MNQKIQDIIDLFKSNDLIRYSPSLYNWVWTQKAKDIAHKKGYEICTNFQVGECSDCVWLLRREDAFGFGWVYSYSENWDNALQLTLKLLEVGPEPEMLDLEDIIL